jgi:uncharacterized protein
LNRAILILALPLLLAAADTPVQAPIRGRQLTLTRLQSTTPPQRGTVIFLPGDGGWRGAAITMSRTIASWGYDVYGFDTKKYLETFSENGSRLSTQELAADVQSIARQLAGHNGRPVILVGWSQGASMAVAAVSGSGGKGPIQGVVTIALPETGVLGWDWKATLAIIARREPDQPTFQVKPLLSGLSPSPLWMIHGTEDEYTKPDASRSLFQAASEPKRMREIQGANHHFDGHEDEMYQSLRKGLEWIASR